MSNFACQRGLRALALMFAVVAAGRLPLTNGQQVDPTHLVFELQDAASVNHVTVFMDGSQPFPPGFSATVHFLWPGEGKEWMLLGCLRNTKPSAIFKLRGTAIPSSARSSAQGQNGAEASLFATGAAVTQIGAATGSVTAQLGISIETDAAVDSQMQALAHATGGAAGAAGSGPADASAGPAASTNGALVKAGVPGGAADENTQLQVAMAIAPKIAKNAYSYLSSFAPDSAPQTAPLLQKWLEQFERKLKSQGAAFLARDD